MTLKKPYSISTPNVALPHPSLWFKPFTKLVPRKPGAHQLSRNRILQGSTRSTLHREVEVIIMLMSCGDLAPPRRMQRRSSTKGARVGIMGSPWALEHMLKTSKARRQALGRTRDRPCSRQGVPVCDSPTSALISSLWSSALNPLIEYGPGSMLRMLTAQFARGRFPSKTQARSRMTMKSLSWASQGRGQPLALNCN